MTWRFAAAALILTGVVAQVAYHSTVPWRPSPPASNALLVLAFMLGTLAYCLMALAWARLRGDDVTWLAAGGPWFASLLARYAPGGVWQGAVRVFALTRGQWRLVGPETARYLTEQALACFSAASIAALTALVIPLDSAVVAVLVVIALATLLASFVLQGCAGVGKWRLAAVGWVLCAHVLIACAAAALYAAWAVADAATLIVVARSTLIAGVIGLLVPIVPAGMGVREGALVWLLLPRIGAGEALALALGIRIVLLVCELAAWGVWALLQAWFGRPESDTRAPVPATPRPVDADPAGRRMRGRRIAEALEHFGKVDLSTASVLDVGCASGLISDEIARRGALVIGVDIDERAIRRAVSIAHRPYFVVASGAILPFASGRFDAVVCNHVYEHALDAHALMAEVHRVLKPGGFCYLAAGHTMQLVEPHHRLPLLSLLPRRVASAWLRWARGEEAYQERFLAPWRLHTLWRDFAEVEFISPAMLRDPERFELASLARQGAALRRLAALLARPLARLAPTWIFLLRR